MTENMLPIDNVNDSHAAPLLFMLPVDMTIETAETLAVELKQILFDEKTDLTLDASQVSNITTPGIQLIVSLEKTLAAQGCAMTITNARDTFTKALTDTGFSSLLENPVMKQEI